METIQKKFFDLVNDFIGKKLLSITKEYTKKDEKEGVYDQYNLESQIDRFFKECMVDFIEKEVKVTGAILNDGKKMIIGGEVMMVTRKDFVEFMKDIYERLEHEKRREMTKLQEEIAKIDFWEKLKELPRCATNGKDLFLDVKKQNDFFYNIISKHGKV